MMTTAWRCTGRISRAMGDLPVQVQGNGVVHILACAIKLLLPNVAIIVTAPKPHNGSWPGWRTNSMQCLRFTLCEVDAQDGRQQREEQVRLTRE
jgi:hypothetical protein